MIMLIVIGSCGLAILTCAAFVLLGVVGFFRGVTAIPGKAVPYRATRRDDPIIFYLTTAFYTVGGAAFGNWLVVKEIGFIKYLIGR